MRVARPVLPVLLLLVAVAFVPQYLAAQTIGGVEQGIKPYGSYEGGDIDSISMANGSITLNIPLLSYPQRGSKLHGGFRLVYTNPWLQPWAVCNPRTHFCSSTGYNLAYLLDPSQCTSGVPGGMTCGTAMSVAADFGYGLNAVLSPGCCPQYVHYYTVTDPDNAVHQMGSIAPGLWRSVDATGYLLAAPSTTANYGTGDSLGSTGQPVLLFDLGDHEDRGPERKPGNPKHVRVDRYPRTRSPRGCFHYRPIALSQLRNCGVPGLDRARTAELRNTSSVMSQSTFLSVPVAHNRPPRLPRTWWA